LLWAAEATKFALLQTTLAGQVASSRNNMVVIVNTWEDGLLRKINREA
jgi:hypothetical protein